MITNGVIFLIHSSNHLTVSNKSGHLICFPDTSLIQTNLFVGTTWFNSPTSTNIQFLPLYAVLQIAAILGPSMYVILKAYNTSKGIKAKTRKKE